MKVLVIPEDFGVDQYLLKPLFEALFKRQFKVTKTKVQVCQASRLGGVGEARKTERIQEIMDRYKSMMDIFILCIDRDFEPLAESRRLTTSPGRGRKPLGLEAARRIDRILQLCPEAFGELAKRLERACA